MPGSSTGSSSSVSTASSRSDRSALTSFFAPRPTAGKDPYPYNCISPSEKEQAETSLSRLSLNDSSRPRDDLRPFDGSNHDCSTQLHSDKPSTAVRPSAEVEASGSVEKSDQLQRPSNASQESLGFDKNCSSSGDRSRRPPSRGQGSSGTGQRPPSRGSRPPSRGQETSSASHRPPSRGSRPSSRGQGTSVTGQGHSSASQVSASRKGRPPSRGQGHSSAGDRCPSKEDLPTTSATKMLSSSDMGEGKAIERSASAVSSSDSINNELSHFKPIASCPRTPPRKLANGTLLDPPVVRTTPRNLAKFSPSQDPSSPGLDPGSPYMIRQLQELAEERKQMVRERSKSTSTATAVLCQTDEDRRWDGGSSHSADWDGGSSHSADWDGGSSHGVDTEVSEKLVRRPLHKQLNLNNDANVDNPAEEGLKTELVIPMESIIEDDDAMDVVTLPFPRVKTESEQVTCLNCEKENAVQVCAGEVTSEQAKHPGNKLKNAVNKSSSNNKSCSINNRRSVKAEHKSLTSPQRSITDWLKVEDRCSGSATNDSSSQNVGHVDDSMVKESSKAGSYLDRNANEKFTTKQDSDFTDTDCEVTFVENKTELKNQRDNLVDHIYSKDSENTESDDASVTHIKKDDISLLSHSEDSRGDDSKDTLPLPEARNGRCKNAFARPVKNSIAGDNKNRNVKAPVLLSSRGRVLKKKRYSSDSEDNTSRILDILLSPTKTRNTLTRRCVKTGLHFQKMSTSESENDTSEECDKKLLFPKKKKLIKKGIRLKKMFVSSESESSSSEECDKKILSPKRKKPVKKGLRLKKKFKSVGNETDSSEVCPVKLLKKPPSPRKRKRIISGPSLKRMCNDLLTQTAVRHGRDVDLLTTSSARTEQHPPCAPSCSRSRKKRCDLTNEDFCETVALSKKTRGLLTGIVDEVLCSTPKITKTGLRSSIRVNKSSVFKNKTYSRKGKRQTSYVSVLPFREKRSKVRKSKVQIGVPLSSMTVPEMKGYVRKRNVRSDTGVSEKGPDDEEKHIDDQSEVSDSQVGRRKTRGWKTKVQNEVEVDQCSYQTKSTKRPRETSSKSSQASSVSASVESFVSSKKSDEKLGKLPSRPKRTQSFQSEDSLDLAQEDYDGLLAQKLQKQFDLEVKLNIVEGRFKGTNEQYFFRRKPKYS